VAGARGEDIEMPARRKPQTVMSKSSTIAEGKECETCLADRAFLRTTTRPGYESGEAKIRVVDLFAGGGGLTIGAAEAARRLGTGTNVVLAVENASAAADVYALNFPKANLDRSDVAELFDGSLGTKLTPRERKLARRIGHVDLLLAGPPCQGHSDLNNHTRREDPRNALYLRAARAVEVLRPTFVVIENVPAVRHDKGDVVGMATATLEAAGYTVASAVLDLVKFGVPQRRRRHILLAVSGKLVDPAELLDMHSPCDSHEERSVRWAIDDLVDSGVSVGPDAPSTPTDVNLRRMRWLIDHGEYNLPNDLRPTCHRDKSHTYDAMYGRLNWDDPAPTITTGFGSMGQGRFVHPSRARTITPHEAARLQTMPDFFDVDTSKGRGAWATVIGNAVPPLLGVHLVEPLLCAMPPTEGHDLVDSMSQPSARANGTARRSRSATPPASSHVIRDRMRNTRRRDTKPEIELRSALHRLGFRFRVDVPINGSRRRSDIVLASDRVVVYVDGCFWHGCSEHGTIPKQNRQWWIDKLAANRARDDDTDADLVAHGWTVLRFWEHEDPLVAAAIVKDVLVSRRKSARRTATGSRR
jgi:DNA (cytosine-5)-methyltransferase 1